MGQVRIARFIASAGGPVLRGNLRIFEKHVQDAHARVSMLGDFGKSASSFFPSKIGKLINGTFRPTIPNSYPKGILGASAGQLPKNVLRTSSL